MDNASKALIMAGAILISVAIVGIGIYIFSAANSMTNDAVNSMESTQVSMFNSEFYRYANEGDSILGTRAKELWNHAVSVGITPTGVESYDAINNRSKYTINYTLDSTGSGYIGGVSITVSGI
ncbi:MAG: hypothetical protein IJ220_04990 [Clostridia bacterium]|nr:hypothetical protein [Clostridia bacterium]